MDVTLCSIVAGSSTSPGDDDGAFKPPVQGRPWGVTSKMWADTGIGYFRRPQANLTPFPGAFFPDVKAPHRSR